MKDGFLFFRIMLVLIIFAIGLRFEGSEGASSPVPQLVEIDDEVILISVSPEDSRSVDIKATVRSPSNQNSVFDIESELKGGYQWTVEHPESIYLEPLEEKEFTITVRAPIGERANTEVDLSVKVSSQTGILDGEDSVIIRVLPYRDARLFADEPYLMNMPMKGSFKINIENTGNIVSPLGVLPYSPEDVDIYADGKIMIEPGDSAFARVRYDLSDATSDSVTFTLEPTIENSNSDGLRIELLPENGRVHILFRRGPFLVLLPDTPEEGSVRILSLGGEVNRIGLEPVVMDEGVTLICGEDLDLASLERGKISFTAKGFQGVRMVNIRAYGYHGGKRIISNPIMMSVSGDEGEDDGFSRTTLIYAGGGVSAVGMTFVGMFAYLYSASEVFRYKLLLLSFIPMYSTIRKEKVLDHFFRGRLFEYIKEHPGVTFTALKEHFDVNNGTLTYHLHKLEKEELVVHRNLGKYKLFYVDGVKIRGVDIVISSIDRRIISVISDNPGIPATRVREMISDDRSTRTISRHLKQLERKGFITSERKDGFRVLFLTGEMERVLMPKKGVVRLSEAAGLDA